MTIAFLIFTILVHISLLDAIGPLMINLPVTLSAEDQLATAALDDTLIAEDVLFNEDEEFAPFASDAEAEPEITHEPGETRAMEGLPAGFKALKSGFKSLVKTKIKSEADAAGIAVPKQSPWMSWLFSPQYQEKPNFMLKWLHPEIYADYGVLRRSVPKVLAPTYPAEIERMVYYPPAMYSQAPRLWIPADPGGVSRQEVKHSEKFVRITDKDGTIGEDGTVKMDFGNVEYLREEERGLRY